MKTKDKIWEILATYNDYVNNTDYDEKEVIDFNYNGENFSIYKEDVEKVKEIIKDLEILEIIKKWSFLDTFYSEYTDTTYNRFLCNIHTKGMKEDFEKVKEWLENE